MVVALLTPLTRFAPSPTGALHLGNARTFLINWLMARQGGWQILFRIEDLDGPRIKHGTDQGLLTDLSWLGLNWDGPILRQSHRRDLYQHALQRLMEAGHAYPCICSRSEVQFAASAPHAEDGSAVYPGTCRFKYTSIEAARRATGREPAVRFAVPADDSAVVTWSDRFLGPRQMDARRLGDFVIAKADGTPAYQLAVVVDDMATGVSEVVRGDDLADSTPRQILLYRALRESGPIPRYTHLPLVIGTDGRRLAKRHGDTRLSTFRVAGVPAAKVLRLIAGWSGVEMSGLAPDSPIESLVERFSLERVPREPVVLDAQRLQLSDE